MINIEIWSDINCPFCFIGKRHLEKAIAAFKQPVAIEWKSFELDPYGHPPKGSDQTDLLAQKYGRDRAWAVQMNANMTEMAKKTGLDFHMETVVPANSFNAHRIIHLAKKYCLQDAMKERLLLAKFKEGKDINDHQTLLTFAQEVGLSGVEAKEVLDGDNFASEVRADEEMAGALGIRGVPFFVFKKKLALSGAQTVEAFLEVLEKIAKET
jgi:predicted DsbA family dithiol-disulfide isomerase